jgi:hypothetical protein
MKSILQAWVSELGLRHQGVLVTALRGPDGAAKHSTAKPIMRAIRRLVLVPFDERESLEPNSFMYFNEATFLDMAWKFSRELDDLPLHFVFHVIHALEVLGYCHPKPKIAGLCKQAYIRLAFKCHLRPESKVEMDTRLTEDRVAKGTVVDN